MLCGSHLRIMRWFLFGVGRSLQATPQPWSTGAPPRSRRLAWLAATHSSLVGSMATRTRLRGAEMVGASARLPSVLKPSTGCRSCAPVLRAPGDRCRCLWQGQTEPREEDARGPLIPPKWSSYRGRALARSRSPGRHATHLSRRDRGSGEQTVDVWSPFASACRPDPLQRWTAWDGEGSDVHCAIPGQPAARNTDAIAMFRLRLQCTLALACFAWRTAIARVRPTARPLKNTLRVHRWTQHAKTKPATWTDP